MFCVCAEGVFVLTRVSSMELQILTRFTIYDCIGSKRKGRMTGKGGRKLILCIVNEE